MKLKKNWLSYIVWAVYACIVAALLFQTGTQMVFQVKGNDYSPVVLMIIGVLLSCVFILTLMKAIALKAPDITLLSEKAKKIYELLGVFAFLFLGIFIRVKWLVLMKDAFIDSEFYQGAIVGGSGTGIKTEVIINAVYMNFLNVVMAVFGNKPIVAGAVQIVFQMFILLFIYGIIRNINGRIPALLALGFLSISKTFVEYLYPLNAELFLIFLVLGILFMASVLWKQNTEQKFTKAGSILLYLLLGMLSGVVLYFDIIGMVVFIAIAWTILISGGNKQTRKWFHKPILLSFLYLISSLAFFALTVFIHGVMINGSMIGLGYLYLAQINQPALILSGYYYPSNYLVVALVLEIFAGIWIIRFWSAKFEELLPYELMLFGVCTLTLGGISNTSYLVFNMLLWVILSAAGVGSLLKYQVADEEEVVEETKPEISPKQSKVELSKKVSQEVIQDVKKEVSVASVPSIQFIPNPLPVPKKHEKKEMDYGYELEEKDMHFDIEDISEDDDYDI